MKNLKVGAKIILGFGIVIALLLVITATVLVSNTSSLNNIANVKDITELKQVCNTLKTEFMEARIQANILYVRISDDAYNKFTALADSLEIGFADAIEFSSQNKGLEMYQATLEENYEVFASWRQSVEQVHTFSDRRSQLQTKLNDVSLRMMDQGQVIYESQINAIAREISGGSDDAVLLYRTSRVDMTQRMKVGIATANISGMKLQQTFDSTLAPDTLKQLDDVVEIVWEYRDSRNPDIEAESANVAAMVSAIRIYQDAVREYAIICDKSDQIVNDAKEKGVAARDLIEKALAEMDTDVNNAIEVTSNSASSSRVITLVVALISVLIAVFMAFLITTGITRPLKFLAVYIKNVADTGNVGLKEENKEESEFYSTYKDEIGDTVKAANNLFELMKFQGDVLQKIANKDLDHYVELRSPQCTIGLIATELLDQLNSVMAAIQDSSKQVSRGSRQIADEALALAQGATEQAASVEELSASITEVAGKIRENAERAACASDLALAIKGNAEKGNAQMESMMRAVEEIDQACQSIGKVIKIIDDIAFQTNILALNASVEAARAGQHGKGFAVVADEVRSLASKSAEAAKSTDRLIADSITKAELGLKIAVETSASFSGIISGINENSQIVSAIAEVAEEQSSAVSQINEGINLVARVVQQNSAASEESAAASQEMDSQAKILAQIASQFKLRQNAEDSKKTPCATSSAEEGFAISAE